MIKQLNIGFKKVDVYTGVEENETADMLAKEEYKMEPISLTKEKGETISRVYQYQEKDVDISPCEFGKATQHIKQIIK